MDQPKQQKKMSSMIILVWNERDMDKEIGWLGR